jgi:SRSO17 transposase
MVVAGSVADNAVVLELLFERIRPRFSRPEPRHRARMYVLGILSGLARKNGWTLAEFAGESDPNGMQRLLTTARWDVEGVRDDLRDWVLDQLGERANAVLVPVEMGFPKKGTGSVGVHRRYNGRIGRVENVQLGLFLSYANAGRWALIDRELFLPPAWVADEQRCRQLGVPESVGFATKPELVRQMVERIQFGLEPVSWFAADETYGDDPALRSWLDQQGFRYVLATRGYDRTSPPRGLLQDATGRPRPTWERHLVGSPPVDYDWARVPGPDGGSSLLVRRSTANPAQLVYYHCRTPAGTPIRELAQVAAVCSTMPEQVEQTRVDLGLDHYQVRRYDAWYRHVTLCLVAGGYLAVVR